MRWLVYVLLNLHPFSCSVQAEGTDPFPKSVAQKSTAPQRVYQLKPAEAKYLKSLLHRCNDGSGQACSEYGHMIMQINRPGDYRTGMAFIHRACVMAYSPACVRPSGNERASVAVNGSAGAAKKTVAPTPTR